VVVIAGGGFAGVELAIQLRTLRPNIEVTLVSPEPHLIFKPWLIYVPAGRRRFEELQIPLAPLAARHGFRLVSDRIVRVDVASQSVQLASAETIRYSELILATGATVDRGRIPGAAEHALFPCSPSDAAKFASEIQSRKPRAVCVAVGWDRRGPGLEFAGWLATRRKRLGLPGLEVTVVDGDGRMAERYGPIEMKAIHDVLAGNGARILPGAGLDAVTPVGVVVAGKAFDSDLTTLVSPARGTDIVLPADHLDERAYVRVDESFETGTKGVFAFGDVAALPTAVAPSKTMVSIRQLVGLLAKNIVARMEGQALQRLEPSTDPHYAMLNIGGRALLLRDNALVGGGRMPLFRRWVYDQSYFRMRS
jgi:sulfide:quinone oxidoreductase